jgi:Tfp pilus assembly protein PilE
MIKTRIQNAFARRIETRKKKGATLFEIIMYLVIAAVILATVALNYGSANTASNTTTAISQLNQIATQIRSLYSGQPTYNGLTTANLASSEALPNSMISGNTIRHVFNGNVTVAAAATTGGADAGFEVNFTNIPKAACEQMLTKDFGRDMFEAGTATGSRQQPDLPFTLPQASAACANSYNTMSWTFN